MGRSGGRRRYQYGGCNGCVGVPQRDVGLREAHHEGRDALCLFAPLTSGFLPSHAPWPAPIPPLLRVCADPNNLPFSNQRGEGFENRLAELIAHDLGAKLEYTWWSQRKSFVKNSLGE